VKTPAMTPGYINRPDATEKLFTADGWLTTNDVIRQDENGFCYFVRRADDMFVCGGENVYPAAVEEILEAHPAVEQACVVPVPDDLKGAKPIAYVVTRSAQSVSENDLKQHVLTHAPAFMHPRRVFFVAQLPLSPTNKIDRSVLQKQALEAVA
jgi:long-chain acyl-CoA synthetase